jgi:hypothetical protein
MLLYAGDTWQLVHIGIAGDDGVPGTLAGHPMVFATLTAPSFGPVHRAGLNPAGRSPRPCHPDGSDRSCGHERPLACTAIHELGDSVVGEPLCADCYDYIGHVLFTWYAPQLWHRFSVALRRLVAQRSREIGEDPAGVRVAYVKVVEMQRRAVPHFHAVIRLDATTGPGEVLAPPHSTLDAAELAALVNRACAHVSLRVSRPGGIFTVRFGGQVDVQPLVTVIGAVRSKEEQVGMRLAKLPGRRVAAYLAKYVTKSVSDVGIGARRLHEGIISELDVTEHVRRILYTIVELAQLPEHQEIGAWLHTLGYRGHITTKTRRYWLRARREAWRQQQRLPDVPEKALGPPTGDPSVEPAPPDWRYVGCGHANDGERLLAISAAGRAREMRRTAREELADEPEPAGPPAGRS